MFIAPTGCYSYNLTDGETSVMNGKEGGTVHFNCNVGYMFDGIHSDMDSVNVSCLANGTLESDIPSCSGEWRLHKRL